MAIKIAICAIIKKENLYLREWVEYHKNIGFDKIIIYDNNDVNGELPHTVIGDYIEAGFVDIYNVRGLKLFDNGESLQDKTYNQCLDEYNNQFEWIAFIDIDEFITIPNLSDIHQLFENFDTHEVDQILMSWYIIGDNGNLFYENKPVTERFTQGCPACFTDKRACELTHYIKSIVRTSASRDNNKMNCHSLFGVPSIHDMKYKCDGYGWQSITSYDNIYVRHYITKSLTEALSGPWLDPNLDINHIMRRIDDYKILNGWPDMHETILNNVLKYKKIIDKCK